VPFSKAATWPARWRSPTSPVRVILNPVTLEETTRVWQALEMSYRLSICYMVRVAMVDSRREQFQQPVLQKTASYQGN
jgi:hypothetical protein